MKNVHYEWDFVIADGDVVASQDKFKLHIWNSDDALGHVDALLDDTECVIHHVASTSGYEVQHIVHLSQRTEEKDREQLLSDLDRINDPSPGSYE